MPTLLLADDSPAIQRLVELTFAQEGIDVTAVGDGEEAIARISAAPPDVVLADIGMPKRSGYEVAAFVKERPQLRTIPVLLLAGAFEPVDEARAAQVHCDGVLVKPFEPQQVIARVRELLGARLAPKAAPPLPAAGDSVESYFDRLDAAFANLDSNAISTRDEIETPIEAERPSAPVDFDIEPPIDYSLNQPLAEPDGDLPVPTMDRVLGLAPPPGAPHRPVPDSPFAAARTNTPQAARRAQTASIADAFSALLAVEQGEPGAQPLRLAVPADPAVTDAMVEEISRRVLDRLSSEALRPIVAEIVSGVSERLVREEIDRIRKQ